MEQITPLSATTIQYIPNIPVACVLRICSEPKSEVKCKQQTTTGIMFLQFTRIVEKAVVELLVTVEQFDVFLLDNRKFRLVYKGSTTID